MRALKMRSAGQPSEVDNNQFRAIIDADPLTTARDVAVELNINHSTVIQHLKQIGKRKISGCLVNWLEIKKIIILKCHLLLFYATTMNNFSFRLWRVTIQKVDFLWQLVMTGSDGGPRSSSKALPKATLTPNKRSWSLSGGLLPIWSTTAFWIPAKPLHLRSMLSKLMSPTENCNACSRH